MASPKERRARIINSIGLSILLVCYAGALFNVFKLRQAEEGYKVIRMAHWQLELGVRDGLDDVIERFEAYKAAQGEKVKILQNPIPEKAYSQFVTTQLIGSTAPDLIQIGKFNEEYLGRYFYPLTKILQEPNPLIGEAYRDLMGRTELTGDEDHYLDVYRRLQEVRWVDTFTDGLRGQYKNDLFEYFGVGFSQFTVRMFYNKDLFREAVGSDAPPETFSDLVRICEKIREYDRTREERIVPIASSKYQVDFMRYRYLSSLTSDLYLREDLDYDGFCSDQEKLMAVLSGDYGLYNEQYRAGLELVNEMASYFPRGFMALGRMDAGFSFVQGRAGMISSGSWDARSFIKKIQDLPDDQSFEVGIFDLPMVTPDHPVYGKFFDGRVSEADTGTGFGFGITRYTEHFDLCIEFLQFCTLPENNTTLNTYAEWIPSVRGALATDMLKKFQPNYVGYWGDMSISFAPDGQAQMVEKQVYWPYISGDITYEQYAESLNEQLPAAAAADYARSYRSYAEILPNRRAKRSAFLAQSALFDDEQQTTKLLRSWDTLVHIENGQRRLDAYMKQTRQRIAEQQHQSDFLEEFNQYLDRERLD